MPTRFNHKFIAGVIEISINHKNEKGIAASILKDFFILSVF